MTMIKSKIIDSQRKKVQHEEMSIYLTNFLCLYKLKKKKNFYKYELFPTNIGTSQTELKQNDEKPIFGLENSIQNIPLPKTFNFWYIAKELINIFPPNIRKVIGIN